MSEAPTVEGRLADMIERLSVHLGHDEYSLSDEERAIVVAALRDRARWMSSDTSSGERARTIKAARDIAVEGQRKIARFLWC